MDVSAQWRPTTGEALVRVEFARLSAKDLIHGSPVRLPGSRRGQRHYPGLFWFSTSGETVIYESLLERDRLWLADFDRDVTAIASQPVHLSGRDGSTARQHVPDFLMEHADGSFTLVDVKAESRLGDPKVVAQFNWTGRMCAELGWQYEVWAGADPVVLANITYLAAGRRLFLMDRAVVEAVAECGTSGLTITEVEDAARTQVTDPRLVRLAVLALLWCGRWRTDLSVTLSSGSLLACGDAAA